MGAGAEFDLSQTVDVSYTWKCNPLRNRCEDTYSVTWHGWLIFIALMVVFLAKDVICGLKMVNLSGKRRHSHGLRLRLFSGGVILWGISMYTVFASAIYIKATATSDTELVTDAAIIIFIMEFDEKLFELIQAHASRWVGCSEPTSKNGKKISKIKMKQKKMEKRDIKTKKKKKKNKWIK